MVLFSGDNLPKSFVPQSMLLTFIVLFHLKTANKTSKHSYKHRGNSLFMLLCTKPQNLLGSHPQEHGQSQKELPGFLAHWFVEVAVESLFLTTDYPYCFCFLSRLSFSSKIVQNTPLCQWPCEFRHTFLYPTVSSLKRLKVFFLDFRTSGVLILNPESVSSFSSLHYSDFVKDIQHIERLKKKLLELFEDLIQFIPVVDWLLLVQALLY